MKKNILVCSYLLSIVLFVISFGYYIIGIAFELFKEIFSLPNGFYQTAYGRALDTLYLEETSLLPMFACFVFALVVSAAILISFRNKFTKKHYFLTASAPLVLIADRIVIDIALSVFKDSSSTALTVTLLAVDLVILLAYAVGFFTAMSQERENIFN